MDDRLDARLRRIPSSSFHDLIAQLCAIDARKGWWQGQGLAGLMHLRRIPKRVVEISASASLRIGGMHRPLTDGRARPPGARGEASRADSAHVSGYAELLRVVYEGYREMRFGEDLIRHFHARLLRYSSNDHHHRGKYKTVSDTTQSYLRRKTDGPALRSADPDVTPQAMASATAWASTRLGSREFHPLLVIAGFVLELLAIRPFVNGNGRVSRMLTNLLLLQCGYAFLSYASLERVIADRWAEYYIALRRSQANAHRPDPDISPWLHAFLEVIRIQADEVRALAEGRPDTTLLSKNQLAVLKLLEREGEITNRLVCSELGMGRDTAKQVLHRLGALNYVRRAGAGRATRYRKAPAQDGGVGPR